MNKVSKNNGDIAPARRGQLIQRVLVEGWSAAQVAAAYGVSERQVARWVGEYRRLGMASLRDGGVAERGLRRWLRRLRALTARLLLGLPVDGQPAEAAPCIELPLARDERRQRR